jgi:dCMP deaminase
VKEVYKLALIDMACRFAETSYAKKLKVGCLIFKNDSVIALGCNGQPPGWHTEVCEDDNGNTLSTVRHSEDAALQKLWNSSETADGAEMFISHKPCLNCSIKIVTAGIRKVYYRHDYRCNDGIEYLLKHSVQIEQIN